MALYWPVDAGVTQQFATNPNSIQPNGHTGIDFATPLNTPLRAAGNGIVVWEGWATRLSASNPWWIAPAYAGICIVIDHGNGILSLYGHLNETHINVGDAVSAGQIIGLTGSTGLSSGPHLHFELLGWPLQPYNGFYGRVNPNNYCKPWTPISLAPASSNTPSNGRIAGSSNINQRSAPNTAAPIVRVIAANSTDEVFDGFVYGEEFAGSNIWFKDSHGYAWAGAFTYSGTDGLPNLTPAPPAPINNRIRIVGPDNVNQRTEPNTSSAVVRVIAGGSTDEEFTHWTRGQNIEGIDIWFKDTHGYSWSGGFTSQSTEGLTEIPVVAPPAPTPVPKPEPAPAKYSFIPDFDFVEYIPAALNNLQIGNFPEKPSHVVIHQFGTPGIDTVNSTINTFTNPNMVRVASSHFVVSGKRIIQMVSLKDRAYHAGKIGNNYVGIETDPNQDADTIASTKKLLKALKEKYGYELVQIRHKDVPENATSCGSLINLDLYTLDVPVTPPVTEPPVVVPVTPPELVITPEMERAVIEKLVKHLLDNYFEKK